MSPRRPLERRSASGEEVEASGTAVLSFQNISHWCGGVAELCEAWTIGTAGSEAATAPSTPIVVSSPVANQLLRLRGPVLQRLPSQPFTLRAAVPPAVAANEDDGEDDEEDHEMETAESAEGGGE